MNVATLITEAAADHGARTPTIHEQRANDAAARIAASEVRAYWVRTGCPEHLASLEAWKRGERSWPWPDPTPEQCAAADAELGRTARGLISDAELLTISRDHARFEREMGRG